MPEDTAPFAAFRHVRDARSATVMIVTGLWLAGLFALWAVVEARLWIIALLTLPVVPALWDIIKNPQSALQIDPDGLRWITPRSQADIARAEIDHVVLLTRWDFSIRATVHTRLGTHHVLPPVVTPKSQELEAALTDQCIPVKRQHFTVL